MPSILDIDILDIGAYHASDVEFVMKMFNEEKIGVKSLLVNHDFSTLYMNPPFAVPGDVKHDVSDLMSCAWANMAKCGSPDCRDCGFSWPRYTGESGQYLLINAEGGTEVLKLRNDGDFQIGESFPPVQKCKKFLNIKTPFHDLRADLNLDPDTAPSDGDLSKTAHVGVNSLTLYVFAVFVILYSP